MGYFRGNSDSKAFLAWDMVDRPVMHLEKNEQAKEGTFDGETGRENILGGLMVVDDPQEAFLLKDKQTKSFQLNIKVVNRDRRQYANKTTI